jgi:quercetin dioxygenase-like cupin family protein
MTVTADRHDEQGHSEPLFLYVLQALPPAEVAGVEAQIAACASCRHELETLRPVVASFVAWPTDVLRPEPSLWDRLARRIADETGTQPMQAASSRRLEPDWVEAKPGLVYKILAADTETGRVSLLVRLAPGADYPPHRHAGVEELHLLDGELWIDDKRLVPGDYNRAEPDTVDHRVWSETGCTCVLLTSSADIIL